jgi:low temperature requirement protein LtrA
VNSEEWPVFDPDPPGPLIGDSERSGQADLSAAVDATPQPRVVGTGGTSPVLRDPGEQSVSPLELLFDLVFVLGVSQLTRHLVVNHTWRGAFETLVLYLPVFAVWAYTSWAATLYSPTHRGTRRMLIAVMAAGLFMNVSLTRAFSDAAWVFVIPFLGIQLGRTAWMLTTPLDSVNRDHFVRTLGWLAATVPLWIAGAAVSPQPRVLVWA